MGFFEQLLSRATLLHVSQEILYGDTLPISEMNIDDMINEVNSKYDSLKEALAKEHINEIDSIVYSYTSDLIDIYHSLGIRAGAKLHSELIGYSNKSSGLPKLLSKNSPGQEVHIKSIIQEIFQGTLNPAEQFETIFETYKEKTKDLDSLISPFYSDLSESQQIAFDNIMNAHLGVVRIELEQSFSDGFKTGIRLMHESLNPAKE